MGVADFANCLAGNLGIVEHSIGCDLAGDDYEARCHKRFTGYARLWIGSQCRVKYSIRDLVGNLVWMAFSNRLGGEQKTGFATQNNSFCVYTDSNFAQKKTAYFSSQRFRVSRRAQLSRGIASALKEHKKLQNVESGEFSRYATPVADI
jgi:hypothetical protein